MPADIRTILSLEMPIIVRLAERAMPLGDVLALAPGSIIEFPKRASDDLELLVNNHRIALGSAVKVGENFGIRISATGDATSRMGAMLDGSDGSHSSALSALDEAFLTGQ